MVSRSRLPFSQDNLNEITLIKHSLNHNKTKIASRESIGYSKKKFNHRLNKYSIIWRDHISISIQSPVPNRSSPDGTHWSDPNLNDNHPEDDIVTERPHYDEINEDLWFSLVLRMVNDSDRITPQIIDRVRDYLDKKKMIEINRRQSLIPHGEEIEFIS